MIDYDSVVCSGIRAQYAAGQKLILPPILARQSQLRTACKVLDLKALFNWI